MLAKHGRIAATGRFVPSHEVTNDALRREFADQVEGIDKLERQTCITRRWYAPDDWSTSDVALPAARQALERAGRRASDVDLILVGTDSPDYITPATSVVLQDKLGATNAGSFDVGCAWASFPTALATASALVATNHQLSTVLVVGAYMMRKLAAPDDMLRFFYGDGAAAVVVEPSSKPGFVASAFSADGSYHRNWGIFAGGTVEPATESAIRAKRTTVQMVKRYPPEVNHVGWPRLVRQVAQTGGFDLSEIDLLLFTQVRKPSIELVMDELALPLSKTHTVMERWGYTGSACVPMALDDALEMGKIAPGALVVMVGSGVGYNQAAVAFRMN